MKKRTFLIGAAAMTGAIIAFRQIFKQENTTDLKSKYNDLSKESNSEKEFSLEDPTEEFVLKLSEHIIYGNISDLMLFDIKRELLCTAIFHVIGSDTEKLYIDMDKELHKVLNLLISKTWEEELKKDQLPQILHVKDLQVLLSISHNTAYELVRSGKIRSIRIGRTYKIPLDAFNEYLRNG